MATSIQVARAPRVPFDQPVWLGDPQGRHPTRRLWAENLSTGGMFVRTQEPLPPGERVLISLEGAGELFPLAEAVVAWRRPPKGKATPGDRTAGVGLAFTQLRPFGDQMLSSMVHARAPGSPPPLSSSARPEPTTPPMDIHPAEAVPERHPRPPPDRPFTTELHLLGAPSVAVRTQGAELTLDFGLRTVARVSQEGQRLTITFRDD